MYFKTISIATLSFMIPAIFHTSSALVPENAKQTDVIDSNSLNFKGQNKYETSILISQNTFESSQNVVILSGENYIDNFPATTLASVLDAPILLVDSSLHNNIINEITRLNAKNAYVVGPINSNVSSDLSKDLNLNVTTLKGSNRFETSIKVANEINKHTPVKEVFIIGANSQVDAISLGSISSKIEAPIIYSHSKELTPMLSDFLNKISLDKVYIIGNSIKDKTITAIKNIHKDTEVLKGTDRYEINSLLNNIFFPTPTGVYYIDKDNIIDSAPLAISAAKKNFAIMLVNNDLTKSQNSYLTTTDIVDVGSAGEVSKEPLLNTLNSLNGISATNNPVDVFNKEKAVFYISHQGDETLYFSSAILNAINTLGKDNVFLVLATDGNNSEAIRSFDTELSNILKESKLDLDNTNDDEFNKTKIFTDARDNELLDAAKSLGIPLTNVKLINGISEGNLSDGSELIKSIITEYEASYRGNVTHISFTPYYDDNKDNLELGKILESLYSDRKIAHSYFIIKEEFSDNVPSDKKIKLSITDTTDFSKLKLAAESYQKLDPTTLRLSIGYKINPGKFKSLDKHINNKSLNTILHIPSELK